MADFLKMIKECNEQSVETEVEFPPDFIFETRKYHQSGLKSFALVRIKNQEADYFFWPKHQTEEFYNLVERLNEKEIRDNFYSLLEESKKK